MKNKYIASVNFNNFTNLAIDFTEVVAVSNRIEERFFKENLHFVDVLTKYGVISVLVNRPTMNPRTAYNTIYDMWMKCQKDLK